MQFRYWYRGLQVLPSFLLLIAAGCGSTSIYVPIERPAEIDLTQFRRITVGLIEVSPAVLPQKPFSIASAFLAETILDQLTASGCENAISTDNFNDQLAKESLFSRRNISRDDLGVLSRILQADGLITGAIVTLQYDEGIRSAALVHYNASTATRNVRKGLLRVGVVLEVIDLSNEVIAWRDTLTAEKSIESKSIDVDPPALDWEPLLETALGDIAQQFAERSSPRTEKAVVTFLTNNNIPAITKGINAAKQGLWKKAITIFSDVRDSMLTLEDEDEAWYNLGTAYLFDGNFKAAHEAFDAANAIKKSGRYLHALDAVYEMEKEYLALQKQKQSIPKQDRSRM